MSQLEGPFWPVFCLEAASSQDKTWLILVFYDTDKTKPHPLQYLQLRHHMPAAVYIHAVTLHGALLIGFVRSHLNPQASLSHHIPQEGAVQSSEPPACAELTTQ